MSDRIMQLEQDVALWRTTLQHKSGKRGCLMRKLPFGMYIEMEDGNKIEASNILDLTNEAIEKGDLKVINGEMPKTS